MNEHLELLRNEYLRLQREHAELRKEYDILVASQKGDQGSSSHSFVQKLVTLVSQLYDKDLYSDITIHCDGHQLRGHRFVISARSSYWDDLSAVDRIELNDVTYTVGCILLKWMYTDRLEGHLGDALLIDVLSAAIKYELQELQERCEVILIGRLDISNCVRFYQFSEERNMERLRNACTQLFAARWNDFSPELFSELSAPFLYRILKSYCQNLLHSIVRLRREDVLFLFFVDFSGQSVELCNKFDNQGILPLDIALDSGQYAIASSLVAHNANVNLVDNDSKSFLVKAVEKGNVDSCDFLMSNGAQLDFKSLGTSETLVHVLAKKPPSERMIQWFAVNISNFDVNLADGQSRSPLLAAIEADNRQVVEFLLSVPAVDTNRLDALGRSALSVALFNKKDINLATSLVNVGADVNAHTDGEYLIHCALRKGNFLALQFLCEKNAKLDLPNSEGLYALHLSASCTPFSEDAIRLLLKAGADPALKSSKDGSTIFHLAIDCHNGEKILRTVITELRGRSLPLSEKNWANQSALANAVLHGKFKCAEILLEAGADINEFESENTLLLTALRAGNDRAAVFLLQHGADACVRSSDGKSCLHLAVESALLSSVRSLCKAGADLNLKDPASGKCPLWIALENDAYEVAYVLVEHGCDLQGWVPNEEGSCVETMLHRAIDQGLVDAAVFLIENGCDVNAMKKSIAKGTDDLRTPLHSCIEKGLEDVALALIESGARVDIQDGDGRTPAHAAVQKQSDKILGSILAKCDPNTLLLRDRYGVSPLVTAMQSRNNTAAEAIVNAAPYTIMQFNGTGENLLHSMVKAADLESVLFLLALHFDVKIPTQNASRATPLHICAQSGNEIIMRNLVLAGADVNAISAKGFTPLHVAAYHNRKDLCSVLLDNGASAKFSDQDGNNALHAAVSRGSVLTVNYLLKESDVDPRAVNKRQQTPLILVASGIVGGASLDILRAFLVSDPDYPVDARDISGNTLFLLAYMAGNAELCRALLRCSICLAATNNYGVSIFNFETPTKQLLFSLLDNLESEPKWAEGDVCSECEAKFTLTMRKHHCRHCGRLVCARCSENTIPILKYDLQKAVRVCQICSDVLTIGTSR